MSIITGNSINRNLDAT